MGPMKIRTGHTGIYPGYALAIQSIHNGLSDVGVAVDIHHHHIAGDGFVHRLGNALYMCVGAYGSFGVASLTLEGISTRKAAVSIRMAS